MLAAIEKTYTSYTLSTVPIVARRRRDLTSCSGTLLLLAQPCESHPEPNDRDLQQCQLHAVEERAINVLEIEQRSRRSAQTRM